MTSTEWPNTDDMDIDLIDPMEAFYNDFKNDADPWYDPDILESRIKELKRQLNSLKMMK